MTNTDSVSDYIDLRFRDILFYIKDNIWDSINDPKEIQGDLNTLNYDDKLKISNKAKSDYDKAKEAISAELEDKDQKNAIKKWVEIFGSEFSGYSED